ncbi:MAG: glycosyltransferase family 87 protein [Planctomycetota bacterium]|nr:glycosyltransferase family 87 protein [Planctomycetota bacterium]
MKTIPLHSGADSQSSPGGGSAPPRRWYHDSRRVWAILALVIVIWGLTDVRRRGRIDPVDTFAHKTDFTVYTEAGAAFFDGRDPYEVTNTRGWHYLYPPLFAIVVAPLAALSSQAQVVVWYFISVAACIGTWFECRRMLRRIGVAMPTWIYWVVGATMALPAMNCLQRGQVGVVLIYFLMLGLRLLIESRSWWSAVLGGVALALPIAIKLTPAMPAGFLVLELAALAYFVRRSYGPTVGEQIGYGWLSRTTGLATGQLAGLALFLVLVPGFFVGQRENIGHLQMWLQRVVTNKEVASVNTFDDRSKRNQSLANATRRLGNFAHAKVYGGDDQAIDLMENFDLPMPMETAAVDWTLRLVMLGLIGMLLTAGWQAAKRRDLLGLIALYGLAGVGSLIVSPISWGHHYVLMLPAVLFVPLWCWQQNQQSRAKWLAVTACGLVLLHYLALGIAGRLGVLGIGTTVWFAYATYCIDWKANSVARSAGQKRQADSEESADRERQHSSALKIPQPSRKAA